MTCLLVTMFRLPTTKLALPILALVVMLACVAALPTNSAAGSADRARQALLDGKVLPLRTVLEQIQQDFSGEPIEIEFDDDDEKFIYEIKLLQETGNILKLKVNASTGEVVKAQGRNIRVRRGS